MAKKAKCYEEGGITEGENPNIDDETRARAMAFLARQQSGDAEAAPTARSAPKPVRRRPAPAKSSRPSTPVPAYPEDGPRRPSMMAPAVQDVADTMRSGAGFRGASDVRAGDMRGRGLRALGGGTTVPGFKKGGAVSKASSRADGIAKKGKTRGKLV